MSDFFDKHKYARIAEDKIIDLYQSKEQLETEPNGKELIEIPEHQFTYIGMKYLDGEFIAEGAEKEIFWRQLRRSELMRKVGIETQLEAITDALLFDDDEKLKSLLLNINEIKLKYEKGA